MGGEDLKHRRDPLDRALTRIHRHLLAVLIALESKIKLALCVACIGVIESADCKAHSRKKITCLPRCGADH